MANRTSLSSHATSGHAAMRQNTSLCYLKCVCLVSFASFISLNLTHRVSLRRRRPRRRYSSRLGAAVQGCGVGRRSSGVVQREDSSDLSHDTTSLSPSGHEDVEPPHQGERRPTPHLKALLGRTEART